MLSIIDSIPLNAPGSNREVPESPLETTDVHNLVSDVTQKCNSVTKWLFVLPYRRGPSVTSEASQSRHVWSSFDKTRSDRIWDDGTSSGLHLFR